jgi:hypothetical protein
MLRIIIALLLLSAAPAVAQTMRPTIYDDGRSCPGGCDAHVVLNRADNGTRFASDPASSRQQPRACVAGAMCRICFSAEDASCMSVRYRGGGPPRGKFDFTPTFFAQTCGRADIPQALKTYCRELDAVVVARGYNTRVNCIASPADPRCAPVISVAKAAQAADEPKRLQCVAEGEARYNARQTDPKARRAQGCNYSLQSLGGPNSNGVRWQVLLPGGCRTGTFVGQNGTDCCSADVRFAASVAPECSKYFPRP